MNFKPILFNTPMIQAILNGSKTQTRRVIKEQFKECKHHLFVEANWKNESSDFVINDEGYAYCKLCGNGVNDSNNFKGVKCPYGKIGDVLWVRETFVQYPVVGKNSTETETEYKADESPIKFRWKPGIHMPKEACRLFLKIKDIRVERLQDISEQDAICEGVIKDIKLPIADFKTKMLYRNYYKKSESVGCEDSRSSFMTLWKSINGEESWCSNPYVWVIEFERIEKPENFI